MNTGLGCFAVVLWTLLCTATPCPAASLPTNEPDFRKQMALEDYKTVSFFDTSGAEIDFAKFVATVATGKSFSMKKNPAKSTAILELKDFTKPVDEKLLVNRASFQAAE